MVIQLNQYRTELAKIVSQPDLFGDELLCANWHPPVGVIIATAFQPAPITSPELPEDFSETDVDEFLARVYGFATLI